MAQMAKARSLRSRSRSANEEFIRFTSSVHFDHRLWKYDIAGSIAHAHALHDNGVLTKAELKTTVSELRRLAKDIVKGAVKFDPWLEDVHMNIEKLLTDRIGDAGAKLHTGRSRNDQVALDMRLAVRELLACTIEDAMGLQSALLSRAKEGADAVMPGYTHMQRAQPVLLSHHLLAHFWRIDRDISRLVDCFRRANTSPLGAGALSGDGYGLDCHVAARILGMGAVAENSLDAVSDRDFVAESAFALSLLMIHLSSLCEELVIWTSSEFGFARIPPQVGGGSSMMPQKVNPDMAELARGKSGRAVGNLVAVLTLLKSLPLAYNRDLQEDKESLFDAFDTAEDSLRALTALVAEIEFDKVRMRKAAEDGLMTATDLADFLTRQGVPFRKAHAEVRALAAKADGNVDEFVHLAHSVLQKYADSEIDPDYLSVGSIIARRTGHGGTSMKSVSRQMGRAEGSIRKNSEILARLMTQTERVHDLLGV